MVFPTATCHRVIVLCLLFCASYCPQCSGIAHAATPSTGLCGFFSCVAWCRGCVSTHGRSIAVVVTVVVLLGVHTQEPMLDLFARLKEEYDQLLTKLDRARQHIDMLEGTHMYHLEQENNKLKAEVLRMQREIMCLKELANKNTMLNKQLATLMRLVECEKEAREKIQEHYDNSVHKHERIIKALDSERAFLLDSLRDEQDSNAKMQHTLKEHLAALGAEHHALREAYDSMRMDAMDQMIEKLKLQTEYDAFKRWASGTCPIRG